MAAICQGQVGAIFATEASRLARNGHEWHRLLEFCAIVDTLLIDHDGVYDPKHPNDRLLLGLKKTSTYSTDFTSGEFNPPFPACPSLYFG